VKSTSLLLNIAERPITDAVGMALYFEVILLLDDAPFHVVLLPFGMGETRHDEDKVTLSISSVCRVRPLPLT